MAQLPVKSVKEQADTVKIYFKMRYDHYKEMAKISKSKGISPNMLARIAVAEYIDRHKKQSEITL